MPALTPRSKQPARYLRFNHDLRVANSTRHHSPLELLADIAVATCQYEGESTKFKFEEEIDIAVGSASTCIRQKVNSETENRPISIQRKAAVLHTAFEREHCETSPGDQPSPVSPLALISQTPARSNEHNRLNGRMRTSLGNLSNGGGQRTNINTAVVRSRLSLCMNRPTAEVLATQEPTRRPPWRRVSDADRQSYHESGNLDTVSQHGYYCRIRRHYRPTDNLLILAAPSRLRTRPPPGSRATAARRAPHL